MEDFDAATRASAQQERPATPDNRPTTPQAARHSSKSRLGEQSPAPKARGSESRPAPPSPSPEPLAAQQPADGEEAAFRAHGVFASSSRKGPNGEELSPTGSKQRPATKALSEVDRASTCALHDFPQLDGSEAHAKEHAEIRVTQLTPGTVTTDVLLSPRHGEAVRISFGHPVQMEVEVDSADPLVAEREPSPKKEDPSPKKEDGLKLATPPRASARKEGAAGEQTPSLSVRVLIEEPIKSEDKHVAPELPDDGTSRQSKRVRTEE